MLPSPTLSSWFSTDRYYPRQARCCCSPPPRLGPLRIGKLITVAFQKGTVPFSSNENWDSPPLIDSPALSEAQPPSPRTSLPHAGEGLHHGSGWGEIRTPGGLSPTAVFKTAALDHSATHPKHLENKVLDVFAKPATMILDTRAYTRCSYPNGNTAFVGVKTSNLYTMGVNHGKDQDYHGREAP